MFEAPIVYFLTLLQLELGDLCFHPPLLSFFGLNREVLQPTAYFNKYAS